MKTPIPVQVEHWLNIVNNKRSPYDLKQTARLHLINIRDIIDRSLKDTNQRHGKNENLFIR
jgi:hypothetical protein